MHRACALVFLLASGLPVVALPGCAARSAAVAVVDGEYPRWVKVGPTASEGTSYYVGTAGRASDRDTGLRAAEEDALTQVTDAARERFLFLFHQALKEAGVQTSSLENLDYQTRGAEAVLATARSVARHDSAYTRPCELPPDAGSPASGPSQPVCEAYVLVSVQDSEADRAFNEALLALRKEAADRAEDKLVTVLDWMQRNR